MQHRSGRLRRTLEWGAGLGFLLAVLLTLCAARLQAVRAGVCADTLRLHILANSDTIEDQLLKLEVRDAVLADVAALTAGAATKQQAAAAVAAALPRLQATAERALRAQNSAQRAVCRLEQMEFAARDYGSFALPAGEYTALRIELGSAEGHNWFCVLYPALCVGSSEARYDDDAENALVFGRYRVRFALAEGWQHLFGRD